MGEFGMLWGRMIRRGGGGEVFSRVRGGGGKRKWGRCEGEKRGVKRVDWRGMKVLGSLGREGVGGG